jgi:hypothetical protein
LGKTKKFRARALLSKEEEAPANQDHLKRQVDSAREQLAGALKILGEKNVNLMKLRRQLDAVPGNSELNQYQRRFTELCTQGFFFLLLLFRPSLSFSKKKQNKNRFYCY